MKTVLIGALIALSAVATTAKAEITLNVRGTDYSLVALMDSCATATGGGDAQLRCFVALTDIVKEQYGAAHSDLTVTDALFALRQVAEIQTADTGLTIKGDGCQIELQYYNNYYYMSRRNVASIDVISAQFDATAIQLDQTLRSQGNGSLTSVGLMQPGAEAVVRGGVALESVDHGFDVKPAAIPVADYAGTVAQTLDAQQHQSFQFVLVHPERNGQSGAIWEAFDTYVQACQQ